MELAAYTTRIGHSALEGLWATYDPSIPEERALEERIHELRLEVWRQALLEVQEQGSPEKLAARWQAVRHQYPVYEDANLLLARLRPVTKLAIITNGVKGLQRRKLEGSGLLHWFDVAVVSGELGVGKPQREIFEHVTKRLGVTPAACLVVGDNPERDVQGGLNSGMKTVWVDRGLRRRTVVAHADVKSLHEVWGCLPVLGGLVLSLDTHSHDSCE